jgi:hypothetical protein
MLSAVITALLLGARHGYDIDHVAAMNATARISNLPLGWVWYRPSDKPRTSGTIPYSPFSDRGRSAAKLERPRLGSPQARFGLRGGVRSRQ